MQTAMKAEKPRKQAISGRFWAGRTYRGRIKDDHKIDICCGTGSFLISALARVKENLQKLPISESEKEKRYAQAQQNCLIGVENDPSMYALAYANMRFHGDGKSNLFNCSSLLIDSYAPIDDSGKTYLNETKIPLYKALRSFGEIDIAMINPPYSLDKKDNSSTREYSIIIRKKELEERIKKANQIIKTLKKKEQKRSVIDEIALIEKEIKTLKSDLLKLDQELDDTGFREIVFSKGQDELDFVAAMLHYIKKDGIGIAIVPMSCAGNSGKKLRTEILQHHTLLASMTMPAQLFFDSHVTQPTCKLVFKAHVPHDNNRATFFSRWKDDGFAVIPHNGRKDAGRWTNIRENWLSELDGTVEPNDIQYIRKKISASDEALAEAYTKTDYRAITKSDFEKTVKKYALYKFMDANGMIGE